MKEKIFTALKNGVVDPTTGKTSINDKTLNAYVEIVAAQISDESQIGAAVAPHIVFLKEVQGNINFVAAEAVKNVKPKASKEKEPEKADDDDIDARIAKILDEKLNPHLSKLEKADKDRVKIERETLITAKAKAVGIPEWRIKEGFNISDDSTEQEITAYMATIKTNIVTAGLEKEGAYSLSTPEDKAKAEAKIWANDLPDKDN